MLPRNTLMLGLALIVSLSHVCQAQNDYDAGLENFFQSRKLIEKLSIRIDGQGLCSDCIAKIDKIAPQLQNNVSGGKLIRIEGFGSQDVGVSEAMRVARIVHDYLRERYKIESSLYLTGYQEEKGGDDAFRVEIVSYDAVLPVDDAKIETVIIR